MGSNEVHQFKSTTFKVSVLLSLERAGLQRSIFLWLGILEMYRNLCVNKVVSNRNQSSPKRSGNIRTGEQSLSIFHCFNFSQFLDERKVNLDIRRQPKRRKYLSVAMISEIRDLTYLLLFAAEWQQWLWWNYQCLRRRWWQFTDHAAHTFHCISKLLVYWVYIRKNTFIIGQKTQTGQYTSFFRYSISPARRSYVPVRCRLKGLRASRILFKISIHQII